MTSTRTVEHRHIDHSDITVHEEGVPSWTITDRTAFLAKLEENGMAPVLCQITGEIVSAESRTDWGGDIFEECTARHWVHVSTFINTDPGEQS